MKFLALYNLYAARVAAALAVTCLVAVFAYGTFLLMAVAHAAELRVMQEEAAQTEGRVSMLQEQYLAQTRGLTLERAYALGFVEPLVQTAVSAAASGLSMVPGPAR